MQGMKKLLALLLCAALCLAPFSPALAAGEGEAVFAVSSAEASPGETAELAISLQDNPGLIAATLKLEYDREKLELLAAEDTGLLPNALFSDSTDTYPYVLMWEASTAPENLTGNGVLARLRFRVREGSEGTAAVWLSCDPENVYDYDLGNVPFTLGSGGITVEEEPVQLHDWSAPEYSWSTDKSLCTASRVCADCGEKEEETVETVVLRVEPGCETEGSCVYTAIFTNEAFSQQEQRIVTPAKGHQMRVVGRSEGALIWQCSICGMSRTEEYGEDTPVLLLSEAAAKPGEEAELTLSLQNDPGIVSMLLELRYDRSRLELVAAEDAGLLPNATFSDHMGADPFILYWEDSTALEDHRENGLLVTLRFRVLAEAAEGEAAVSLSYEAENIYNGAMENVAFALKDGAVCVEKSAAPDVPPPAEPETITVRFRLIGDTLHEDACEGHTAYVTWIPTTAYTLEKGDTVCTLFLLALAEAGLGQTGAERGFVKTITAPAVLGGFVLGGTDNGPVSGWMYTVNGQHPQVTLEDFVLADGDSVVWHYCDDYTLEESPGAPYYARWMEAADISPEDYVRLQEPGPGPETPDPGTEPGDGGDGSEQTAAQAPSFLDVGEEDWFFADVAFCAEKGLMEGVGEELFAPGTTTSRAMLLTILHRLEGTPEAGASGFADVPEGTWYSAAIGWAAGIGLVEGYGDGRFGPADPLTREQLVTVLLRYCRLKNYDCYAADELTAFADRETVSGYALSAVRWAVAEGLLRGRAADRLVPGGSCTRAELAAILHRFCETVAAEEQ